LVERFKAQRSEDELCRGEGGVKAMNAALLTLREGYRPYLLTLVMLNLRNTLLEGMLITQEGVTWKGLYGVDLLRV
jgi:hypothetical protein